MIAILHEGNAKNTADNQLLKLLIKNLGLDEKKVKFFGLDCKSNFFKIDYPAYKELLLKIDEKTISKVLFVADADYEKNDKKCGGFEKTKSELEKIINELDLSAMSDVYVTCDPQTKDGYLESLILSSIPKEEKECIETFLECSDFKSKENHKSILNQIYKIAYPNAPFDLSHKNFDELKQKLKNLFEGL